MPLYVIGYDGEKVEVPPEVEAGGSEAIQEWMAEKRRVEPVGGEPEDGGEVAVDVEEEMGAVEEAGPDLLEAEGGER